MSCWYVCTTSNKYRWDCDCFSLFVGYLYSKVARLALLWRSGHSWAHCWHRGETFGHSLLGNWQVTTRMPPSLRCNLTPVRRLLCRPNGPIKASRGVPCKYKECITEKDFVQQIFIVQNLGWTNFVHTEECQYWVGNCVFLVATDNKRILTDRKKWFEKQLSCSNAYQI